MTQETYTLLRADFLHEYGDTLCEESIADIQAAERVEDFIDVLHKYITYARLKPFPTSDWVRKWFANEKALANAHGVYIDQITNINGSPLESIVLFGKCHINYSSFNSQRCVFLVQDTSVLNIISFGISHFQVRLKNDGKCNVMHKDINTQVKIHNL